MTKDPYQRAESARFDRLVEFRAFQALAPDRINTLIRSTEGFAAISKRKPHYLNVDHENGPTVCVSFAKIPLVGRKNIDGSIASESGPKLLYSRSPGGEMATFLYPTTCSLYRVEEEGLLIRCGYFTCAQLMDFIAKDLEDLVTYGYVTNMDITPTFMQKRRVGWLQFAKAHIKDGEVLDARITKIRKDAVKAIASGSISGFFRFVMPFILGFIAAKSTVDFRSMLPW